MERGGGGGGGDGGGRGRRIGNKYYVSEFVICNYCMANNQMIVVAVFLSF